METIFVKYAKYICDYKIEIIFSNAASGIIDFEPYLNGEIFSPLLDKNFFKHFKLNQWTLEWENGADFSPEFLHEILHENTVLS